MAGIADVQTLHDDVPVVKERTTKGAEVSEQLYGERIARLEGSAEHWATKADVERVRSDVAGVLVKVEGVRTEVEAVRTEVEKVRTEVEAVRTEVEKVRTDVAGLESRVDSVQREIGHLKWFIGIGVVLGVAIGNGVVILLSRLLAGGVP